MLKQFIKNLPFGLSILLFAVAVGILALIAPIGGNKALIVRSGSMEPAIKTGDLILVKPQATYKIGDVISFSDPQKPKTTVTHRIADIQQQDGKTFYKTKGDANEEADFNLVPAKNVIGAADHSISGVGKLFAQIKTKNGFLAAIVTPAIFVIFLELVSIFKEIKKGKNKTPRAIYRRAMKHLYLHYGKPMGVSHQNGSFKSLFKTSLHSNNIFVFILPIFLGLLLVKTTYAQFFYTDTEVSTANLFQAASSFPTPSTSPTPTPTPTPSPTQCTTTNGASVVINEINWVGSNGDGLDEWVELCNTTNSPINLANWVVENLGTGSGPGANVTIPSGIILANGFFIISNNDQSSSAINVAPDLVDTNVSLNNGGEQLILKNDVGTIIDTANGTGAWLAGSNATPKKTMERKSPVSDGTQAANWQTATTHTNMDASGPTDEFGTPKAPNGL